MGKLEINQKLKDFLIMQPFSRECESLYLMVEIRKILDHAYDRKNYTLLRFYCDWTLHTDKRQNLEYISPIIEKIYNEIKFHIENHPFRPKELPLKNFEYMEELKKEMKQFLTKEELQTDLCDNNLFWVEFVKLLVSILANQPIIKPTKDIKYFTLSPSAPGTVQGDIGFTEPISNKDGNYNHYLFYNTY